MTASTAAVVRHRARWFVPVVLAVALAACGGDGSDDQTAAPQNPADPAPAPAPTPTPEPTPQPERNTAYLGAAKGDVLKVRIEELHPTQKAIGYDQIYYKLGRWQGDPDRTTWQDKPALQLDYLQRTIQKKFEDYCEDTGQGALDAASLDTLDKLKTARLDDQDSFACVDAPGAHVDNLKTVVVGWDGNLYLTDGHHSMSSLREVADGGPSLPVWVLVDANYSDIGSRDAFWQRMIDERKTWLRDGDNQPITVDQLPTRLGLASDAEPGGMQNDPYRALVYFTRDIGYKNGGLQEFAEFLWADWLRGQVTLADYKTAAPATPADILAVSEIKKALTTGGSNDSYAAAVRDSALRMSQLADTDPVYDDRTAATLGRIVLEPGADKGTVTADARDELEKLPRNDVNKSDEPRGAGKLWFAVNYKLCGKPAAGTACWGY